MDVKDTWEDPYDFERTEICPFSSYDVGEAKERASIVWLLSKAFDGVIPSELREPFYRDHERHRRLKPKIVHSLANAELYCLALANIYSDPNYHNLDHHSVIQALMRKGICLMEAADSPLTETVLVQTAPIKLSAHLAVIEGMISLYIKEVLIPEKIIDVVRSFSHVNTDTEMPSNSEEAAVLWINKCCNSLEQEIKEEFQTQESFDKLPRIPVLQEISDISDGCSLAAVICFYCPNHMNWQDVCWNNPMSLGDSIYNLQLIKRFCCDNLPRYIDFLTLEDFLYVHPTIKDNVLVFVAELLFSFVIWPANCVTRPVAHEFVETSQNQFEGKPRSNSIPSHKAHQISCSAIPNLRADTYGGSSSSLPELRPGCGASQTGKESSEKANSRKCNLPSERLRMSPRLHRTNSSGVVNGYKSSNTSLTDSADNDLRLTSSGNVRRDILHSALPKDNPARADGVGQSTEDKLSTGLEVYYHSLAADGPIRSGSLSNIRENSAWKKTVNERPSLKSSSSSQSSGICVSDTDKQLSKTSFAKLSKEPETKTHGINIVYMQHERDGVAGDSKSLKKNFLQKGKSEKRATFAALPNTTTWQQQRILSSNSSQTDSGHETPVEASDPSLNIQLANLRMKLEEKRRRIELEKKRMEALWKRERQKIGKVAFLQAVSRGSGGDADTPDSGTGKDVDEMEPTLAEKSFEAVASSQSLVRRMSIQEIAEDIDSVQKKWLQGSETAAAVHQTLTATTDDGQIANDFEASIEQLNSSLCDLQADISRITIQQEHVENLLQDSVEDASHFFLHGEPTPSQLQESPVKTYKWNSVPHSSYPMQPSSSQQLSNQFSPISMSPQKHPYQCLVERQSSREETASPSQKQELPNVNLEELYSKVIKPSNRQKAKASNQCGSLPSEPSADKDIRQMQQGYELSSRTGKQALHQNSREYSPHRNQPEYSYQSVRDSSPHKKSSVDEDQGFYISFDDQPKKTTTKWQRPSNDIKNVQQTLPNKETPDLNSFGFVIGADLVHPDPETEIEMAKKKELIMNLSIRRRADHENRRLIKEQEYARLRDEEQRKREYMEKKREEERQRRQAILEQYRQRKLQEELEKEGVKDSPTGSRSQTSGHAKQRSRTSAKPRPKSSYISTTGGDASLCSVDSSIANKRNSQFISTSKDVPEFDIDSLNSTSTSASSRDRTRSPTNGHLSSCQVSPSQHSGDGVPRPLECGGRSSDGASDTTSNSSNAAMMMEYTGPKLFVKPTAKSNRGIIINAINTVLAGAVNSETKKKVVEEINKSESKHFLILFRDAGCQFRAIYSYNPDTDEVIKLYGIGPKTVGDKVMEKFYKYNSGGKCFSEVQTKHLTVTIDAFTIPNSLWAGKKIVPPRKEFF